MILYALKCANDHAFEGWFRSSADYARQIKRHAIGCPECGSTEVEKAVMAPNVARTDKTEAPGPQLPEPMPPANPPSPAAGVAAGPPPNPEKFFAALRRHVEEHFDYVGENFPEEARKMHYGETDDRPIYGEASQEEARELIDEGIEVAPLPGGKKKRSRARMN
jgi:hypothetical protein